MSELLDIVDEQDVIIGQAEREEVHRVGLRCRLLYVCFYTADGSVLLQKRSDTKKNDAGKLTTAVSGHVGSGQTYLEAAVREAYEETGIRITDDQLIDCGTVSNYLVQGDYISNAIRQIYLYQFAGSFADLTVEDGDGAGFVSLSAGEFQSQLATEPEKFAAAISDTIGQKLVQEISRRLVV